MKKKLLFITLALCTGFLFAAQNNKRKPDNHPDATAAQASKIDDNQNLTMQLMGACKEGNLKAVQQLIVQGANITDGAKYTNGDTVTPLGIACDKGHVEIAAFLLEKGANITGGAVTTNRATITPLGIACDRGHVAVATLLLDRGTTITDGKVATNGTTRTPLGIACINDHVAVVTLLLEKGAIFKRIDSNGLNAYQATHNDEIKELIKEYALKEQKQDLITLELFQNNQRLHLLECCLNHIDRGDYLQIKHEGNDRCPVCNGAQLTPLNESVYVFPTRTIGTNTPN